MTQPRRTSLAFTLLLAMLAVVLLSFGGTVLFANWAVQREFQQLPPEVQEFLRYRKQGARSNSALLRTPALPAPLTTPTIGPVLPPDWNVPNVPGNAVAPPGSTSTDASARWRTARDPNRTALRRLYRSEDFVMTIQGIVWRVGICMAVVSALLSWVLSRRIARPLTEVSEAAKRLASGDLNARASMAHTEREVAELALNFNQMATDLQALESERQQAAADIAHELRTPIAVMQARLDALEDGIYPLDLAQVASLSQQTLLLSRLVDDLRTLTLADAGQLVIRKEVVDLAQLCSSAATDLQDRAKVGGLKLNFALSGNPLTKVEGDPDRLKQIVFNLLENALRHAHMQVDMTLISSGNNVQISVDDDGLGIPKAARDKVFTRFTRLDESRSRGTGGSGLGLAIVQAFVRTHQGAVSASESPLGGARLTVTVPALCDHPQAGAKPR